MNGSVSAIFQRAWFRVTLSLTIASLWRTFLLRLRGARIGSGTKIPPCLVNWPHQLSLGDACILEDDITFTFSDSWRPGPSIRIGDRVFIGTHCEFNICESIVVGNDALIASGCKFIDHNHGIEIGIPMNRQPNASLPIRIEEDSWIGVNVVVLKGVTIGAGAIVGAGAVVTKSVPAMEIWAGIPARKIGERAAIKGDPPAAAAAGASPLSR